MPHQAVLEDHLRQLHLSTFVQNYQAFAQDATRTNLAYERYLLALCEHEIASRRAHRIQRAIAQAKLPIHKELADFDFTAIPTLPKQRVLDLAQGEYLSKAETVILIGNPGLGKTHIAIGLALEACRQGKQVRFYSVSNLINDLQAAQRDLRFSQATARFAKLDLLVLDEVGYSPFREGQAQVLFQLCSELYERVSIIVTTNLRFADWNKVFQDETLTAALLDRLIHKAHILEFVGESYRFRQRRELDEQAQGSGTTGAG